jgi:nucleotide-binding universal stress UspA family protein
MKLLLAYDGSTAGDAAVDDLEYAGLPRTLETHVLSVADVWLPDDSDIKDADESELLEPVWKARRHARLVLKEAKEQAADVAKRLQERYPSWSITAQGIADSPSFAIVQTAEQWGADLLAVGSHGRSALDRVLLGSVSQTVLSHAHCSVRIGRTHPTTMEGTPRLVVGYDASPNADIAIEKLAERNWPAGAQALLVTAIDPMIASRNPWSLTWLKGNPAEQFQDVADWLHSMAEGAADHLRAAGLEVSTLIKEGDAKSILLAEAERSQAHCIFVGARGLSRIERLLLGSVSTAIASRAPCSVEVVRV